MAQKRFAGPYELTKRVLSGDAARGIAELWRAQDYGNVYYLKLWKRLGDDRADIGALWNREVRSLMRLHGYPGAGELFVRLHDLSFDDKQYYAVFDSGQRTVLSEVFESPDRFPWLRNLGEVSRRRALWEGLLRIAEALAILHAEGTLHRAVSPASIFVNPDGLGDFRLSGFEWSLRLAGSDIAAAKVGQRNLVSAPELDGAESEYSIATDWFDFGIVCAELFGVPAPRLKNRKKIREAIASHRYLAAGERETILRLLEEEHELRLANADEITLALRDVLRELGTVSLGANRPLILALRLGAGTSVSKAVEVASSGKAAATDGVAQRQWVEHDLRGDIRVTARTGNVPCFILHGAQLQYRVRPWAVDGASTWNVGFCDMVEQAPKFLGDDQRYSIGLRKLDIRPLPEVQRAILGLRDRGVAWDKLFPFARSRRQLEPYLRDVHDFFRVTQQLDTLLTIASICPVTIASIERATNETVVEVTPNEEADRNDLCQFLGLDRPSDQLRDWFNLGAETVVVEDEDDPKRDEYQFLFGRTLDSDSSDGPWRFQRARSEKSGPMYRFLCPGIVPIRQGRAYLARSHGGTLAQIKRRNRLIEDMRSHEDLLKLVANPRDLTKRVNEPLPTPTEATEIDEAKQRALERLWVTRPSFCLQGPPGTGKTTLIKAFADRLFGGDPGAQILITAHSHHTVDDVRHKLQEMFSRSLGDDAPIMVRLSGREPSEHDVERVTLKLVKDFSDSALVKGAPQKLSERVLGAVDPEPPEASENELRTMQILVQDSANVTFTTSNSSDIADLAGRGRRFDWSIIEEAGKAHGFDMAGALQSSHRLLLIGDHRQLPPFNANVFKQLLGDPLRVKKALQIGAQFAPTLIDRTLADDDEDRTSFVDRCEWWRSMIALFGSIFERSLGPADDESGPAATLTQQHRMHPAIAELVGRIFYPDDLGGTILKTSEQTHTEFTFNPPFEVDEESWLPSSRIVWLDIPWVQKKEWSEGEADGLFESRVEARQIVEVLDQFRHRDNRSCEIQILSPYNDQLRAIRETIQHARSKGRLGRMFAAPFNLHEERRSGATVDEFQGSEADIVIVSLVRNNGLVPWQSLGFLREENRMNVLLSRARHKLILVGSWEFFESRCSSATPVDADYAYIRIMMREMARAEKEGQLARVKIQP